MPLKSICVIASGMDDYNALLQPWRYISEICLQLGIIGHSVTLISDGSGPVTALQQKGINIQRISSVKNPIWKTNRELIHTIDKSSPDVIIWHVGLISFLYQALPCCTNTPIVGLFSNPIYRARELIRLGPGRLIRGHYLSVVPLVGSLIPNWAIQSMAPERNLTAMAVQTKTTRNALHQAGFGKKSIRVIPPGVDDWWLEKNNHHSSEIRRGWGFTQDDLVTLFFGSPAELRGLPNLVRAFVLARQQVPNLKLAILSRRKADQWLYEEALVQGMIDKYHLGSDVIRMDGFLAPDALVKNVAAADIVALPFDLLPSDSPLSILEARALGKPVITTRVACLPELVSDGEGYLSDPANPQDLAKAIIQAAAVRFDMRQRGGSTSESNYCRTWQAMGVEWSSFLQSL